MEQRLLYLNIHLILDNHSFDPSINTDPNIGDILNPVWRQMAEYFKERSNLVYYEILNDKVKLYNVATKLGVPVPLKYDSLESAQFPFVIKPTNLSSSKGVVYVRKDSELPPNLDTTQDILFIVKMVRSFQDMDIKDWRNILYLVDPALIEKSLVILD